jgi:deoxycytidylate deaminase
MKLQPSRIIALMLSVILALGYADTFAKNKKGEPETVEIVSVKATGKIEGVVRDMQGQPIKNAVISVEGCKTGAMTNERGIFYLREVPCGSCTLKVLKAGFESSENVLVVKENARATIKIVMKENVG